MGAAPIEVSNLTSLKAIRTLHDITRCAILPCRRRSSHRRRCQRSAALLRRVAPLARARRAHRAMRARGAPETIWALDGIHEPQGSEIHEMTEVLSTIASTIYY